jgi:hypothetical protein
MKRPHAVVWSLAGLLAGAVGWLAGALIGSNMGRSVLAATAIAAVFGLLAGRPRLALLTALATAVVATVAYFVGLRVITPLIAWPATGLVIGLCCLPLFGRTRARVATIVAAPLVGSLGFFAGMVGTNLTGMAMNDARLISHMLGGGAAGFGLLTLTTIRLLGTRLDRVAAPKGGAA